MSRIDRRVARTRAQLQQAHLALIVERGFEAVTVEDICAAADVGRSTFYAHYPNKGALHRDGLEALRRQLLAHGSQAATGASGRDRALGFSLPMFEHARAHLDLYRALTRGPAGTAVLDEIRGLVSDLVRAQLPAPPPSPGGERMPREFAVRYLAGAYISVLTWWLDNGAAAPPEEMDALFQEAAACGLGL